MTTDPRQSSDHGHAKPGPGAGAGDPESRQWLVSLLRERGRELGFQQIGISTVELGPHEEWLRQWLKRGWHGEMEWMAAHGDLRSRPAQLMPGTLSVISARMDYLPPDTQPLKILASPRHGYISRYALGRDYHRLMRRRLAKLADTLREQLQGGQYRVFSDSAPVLERALATQAGLGWIGKNTMLIHPRAGSWFFLGEIYTSLPLPADRQPMDNHCGSCRACLDICPTRAFAAPYQLDARRCISYLTIELKGSIPVELRPLIGNRVFGCDDCQLVCPWNKFARPTAEGDFHPRHGLSNARLTKLFEMDETDFDALTRGSPIRRIGYQRWLRNLAVALGNAPYEPDILNALNRRLQHPSALVREHVQWALEQQDRRRAEGTGGSRSSDPIQPT